MTRPIIVYDTAIAQFQENRIFDYDYAAKFPGASMWALLGKHVKDRGWSVMTSDVYLRSLLQPAVCISEMVTPYTEPLLKHGAVPAVILSGESPNVAWDFYRRLKMHTRPYHHAYVFRGAISRVFPAVKARPFYWPNAFRELQPGPPWRDREYMVMVASNKSRHVVRRDRPFAGVRGVAKRVLWDVLKIIDPFFKFTDLYQKRLEAILYFSTVPGFRLYGTGWDNLSEKSKYHQAAKRIGAVSVADKLATMIKFKYTLCMENCVFPGYITEKIFDCFFSGSIPVYWGAPDIKEFIPKESFVDAGQFNSFKDVDYFLRKISPDEARRYLEAARDFLASTEFDRFYQGAFLKELVDILELEFMS